MPVGESIMSFVRLLLVGLCLIPALSIAAQDAPDSQTAPMVVESALGVRQQRVGRMMSELERRFLALAKSIEEKEPERAARLVKAFEESRSLLVEQRMAQIVTMLNTAKLDNASNEQQQVLDDVRKLITILLSENGDKEQDRDEVELLKKWHQQIAELRRDEQQQRAATEKLDKKDEATERLQKQIEAVKELIQKQDELAKQTAAAKAANVAGLPALGDKQQSLRSDTEFVAKSMNSPQAGPPSVQTSDKQPGQKPLEHATEQQQDAEQKLQAGEGKAAQQSQEKALDELKKSLAELEQELQRLQKPPENAQQQMAQQQEQTEKKNNALGNQMSKAAAAAKPGNSSCSSSCSQCVSKASQHMQNAAQSLKKNSTSSAAQEQKHAEDELKKAQEQIEKRLSELGEKLDNETLVRLEELFTDMLTKQRQTTAHTVQFNADHNAEKGLELKRADRLTLRRLTQEERDLAEMSQQALALIEADATSVSFPVVVANMNDNLMQIATRLAEAETGAYTQALQVEVEQTLEELIAALQVAKKQGGGGSGGGKPGNCKPALLPNTAELKMLRALQLRVNRRTKAFDDARPNGQLDDARRKEVLAISNVQKDLGGMVRSIIQRTKTALP